MLCLLWIVVGFVANCCGLRLCIACGLLAFVLLDCFGFLCLVVFGLVVIWFLGCKIGCALLRLVGVCFVVVLLVVGFVYYRCFDFVLCCTVSCRSIR